MSPELVEKVRKALDAWLEGNVTTIAELLDPDVELLWWKTGEWDFRGKPAVLELIKKRNRAPVAMELLDAGPEALVVSRGATPDDGVYPATLITFRNDKIVKIHQFRTTQEALQAAPWRARA
ncbi:MAG: nuclear transport factor 2 family protein [Actinomycetota bacterium]